MLQDELAKQTADLFGTPIPGQGTEPMVRKRLYDARMYLRERGALTTGNPMLDDPENWLRDRLRRGGRITYDREVELKRSLISVAEAVVNSRVWLAPRPSLAVLPR